LTAFNRADIRRYQVLRAVAKREPNIFTTSFLDALGRWQRGWRRDKASRLPIAKALEREAVNLPARFRQFSGKLYRKRHLYKTEDMSELAPLFLTGVLDECSATSWSSDYNYIERLGDETSFPQPNVASGAIFAHVPAQHEIVLNIPSLWADPAFEAAVNSYQASGGRETAGLRNFNVTQSEVVLRTPLQLSEIHALSLPGNFQSLATSMGFTKANEHLLHQLLQTAGIDLSRPFVISQARTAPIIGKVVASITAKIVAWKAVRTPHPGRLADAVALGDAVQAPSARFRAGGDYPPTAPWRRAGRMAPSPINAGATPGYTDAILASVRPDFCRRNGRWCREADGPAVLAE
jgi:hypothetical protein